MAGLGSNQHTASQWSQERMNQKPLAPINKATIQQLLRWPASRQSDHDQWLLPQLLNTHTLTHSLQAQQEPCGLKLSHCRVSSLQGPTQLPMPQSGPGSCRRVCEDQEVSQVGSVTASLRLPCHCLPANQSSAFDLPQPLLIPLERALLLSAFGEA